MVGLGHRGTLTTGQPTTDAARRDAARSFRHPEMEPSMSLTRIITTWLVLAVVMSANGILRELALKRWMTAGAAEWTSLVLGLTLILAVTRVGFRGIPSAYPTLSLLLVGAFLVALTVVFEFAIGLGVDRKPFAELLGAYAFWRGEPWPLVLLVLGLTPLLWRGRG
jgi:hypothetical protein